MINLLPPTHKEEIRAGRTNVLLVRYIAILLCAAVVLGGLLVGAYIVLNSTKSIAEEKVAENVARTSAFQNTRAQSDAFRSDLATAKTIMDGKISFSKLIYEIAAIVPPNVVLDNLTLDPQTFGSSIDLTASAKSFDDATKLRDAFSNNNQVFTDVSLQTIRNPESPTTDDPYPVKVTLSVVINKGALQ